MSTSGKKIMATGTVKFNEDYTKVESITAAASKEKVEGIERASFLGNPHLCTVRTEDLDRLEQELAELQAVFFASDPAVRDAFLARSATPPRVMAMPLLKLLREQRDALADLLREIHHRGLVTEANVEERIRLALKKVPTYEQQLENVANGLGMTADELRAALDGTASGKGQG